MCERSAEDLGVALRQLNPHQRSLSSNLSDLFWTTNHPVYRVFSCQSGGPMGRVAVTVKGVSLSCWKGLCSPSSTVTSILLFMRSLCQVHIGLLQTNRHRTPRFHTRQNRQTRFHPRAQKTCGARRCAPPRVERAYPGHTFEVRSLSRGGLATVCGDLRLMPLAPWLREGRTQTRPVWE